MFGKKKKNSLSKTDKQNSGSMKLLERVLYGNVVSTEFFSRHWIKVFLVVIIAMIFISTKYQCMTATEQIKELQKELNVARTESVRERSTYMSRIRESAMKELVDTILPGLAVPEHPAYILNLNPSPDSNTDNENKE